MKNLVSCGMAGGRCTERENERANGSNIRQRYVSNRSDRGT